MVVVSAILILLLFQCGVDGRKRERGRFDYDNVKDFLADFMAPGGWNDLMEMGLPGPYNIKDAPEQVNEDTSADKELLFKVDVNETRCVSKPNPEKCKCGIRMGRRIVGGYKAKMNDHPWMVALIMKGQSNPFCGGTLISDQWLITAAHCVYQKRSLNEIQVSLGNYHVEEKDEGEVTMDIDEIVMPDFSNEKGHQDIALLKLNSSVELTHSIYPACLPIAYGDDCVWTGENVTVAGWGKIAEEKSDRPNYLQVNEIPVVSWEYCRSKYYHLAWDNFCTYKNAADTCHGDSGGPVLYENEGRQYVIGVISWGSGCARKYKPGVSVSVAEHLDWILTVAGNPACDD